MFINMMLMLGAVEALMGLPVLLVFVIEQIQKVQ